jgi:ribosomal-protein-alanine N-acetyltransferase
MNRLAESGMLPKLREFFKKFPTINLGNITLRDMRMSDNIAYYEYLNNPMVSQYLSDEDIPRDEKEALDCVKAWGSLFYNKQGIFWTIADTQTDKLIGSIGLSSWNFLNRRAEISYDLAEDYWGKGIATKAITNVLKVAFNEMMLYRIEARTMEKNATSQHILSKFKFQQEGVLRGYRIIRGKPEDIYMYSLIRTDYSELLLK